MNSRAPCDLKGLGVCFSSLILLTLVLAGIGMTPVTARGEQLQNQPQVLNLTSPNVRVVNNESFICVSADVPVSREPLHIVQIKPRPEPRVMRHMILFICDEPGLRGATGESFAWDCSQDYFFGHPTPSLTPGPECRLAEKESYHVRFQYEGGSGEEGSLILPPGTGIPITGQKSLIAVFHFPHLEKTMNGMTGVSGLEVTLAQAQKGMQSADAVMLAAAGFIGPQSVCSVTGSWKIRGKEIQVLRIYSHWHESAIGVQVGVERTSGETHVILDQDPHKFSGISIIPQTPDSILSPGDRLTYRCTYNNTHSVPRRVANDEMCYVMLFYSVDGNETLSDTSIVSFDPRTARCFPEYTGWMFATNVDGRSSYEAEIPENVCFV